MGVLPVKLHGVLVRLFYRIFAPSHPRGWLDFHCVGEDSPGEERYWIHCHGMERFGCPDLEIVDVQHDLTGFAHGIMFEILGYMKGGKKVLPDENMGGCFVSQHQTVLHLCTFRLSDREGNGSGNKTLRVVDQGAPLESGFPAKLFAAHLHALASTVKDPAKQVDMMEKAVRIHPGEASSASGDPNQAEENPGNFFCWELLGNACCDLGREDDGLRALRTARDRWPWGAAQTAKAICEQIEQGNLPPAEKDARARFWLETHRLADGL